MKLVTWKTGYEKMRRRKKRDEALDKISQCLCKALTSGYEVHAISNYGF